METEQLLRDRSAGGKAIRGGVLRVAGYGLGMVVTAAASVALLRHLGVEDFGRYATVTAIIAIVGGITDAGLNVIGQREYVLRPTPEQKRELLDDIIGIRLVITPLAVAGAVLFAFAAGYDGAMVLGAALAGAGLLFANIAASLMLPLSAALRLGWVTAIDLARQTGIMVVIVALVIAGASLAPFFAAHIAGGIAALVVAALALGSGAAQRPRFAWTRWKPLLIAAAPVAVSLVMNVIYLRVLLVMMSLLATEAETGLFATSFRVLEIFLGIPLLMVGAAFPILVRAGADDESRLVYAMQRLVEASVLVSAALVLGLAIAAEPVLVLLGGEEYRAAADVLRLQCFVLVPAFLTQVWAFALVSIHRQRAVVTINAVALGAVLLLGAVLIPLAAEQGAAAAAVVGEFALAASALWLLLRAAPALRPELARVWRMALAALVAAVVALLPGLPALVAGALAVLLFAALAWILGAVPRELLDALVRRSEAR